MPKLYVGIERLKWPDPHSHNASAAMMRRKYRHERTEIITYVIRDPNQWKIVVLLFSDRPRLRRSLTVEWSTVIVFASHNLLLSCDLHLHKYQGYVLPEPCSARRWSLFLASTPADTVRDLTCLPHSFLLYLLRGMARLSWPALHTETVYPWVTHPSINRARRRATLLMKTNVLPHYMSV